MKSSSKNLKRASIVLAILTLAGLVADYLVNPASFPGVYTLAPLCLLITVLLVMMVIWLFNKLINSGL